MTAIALIRKARLTFACSYFTRAAVYTRMYVNFMYCTQRLNTLGTLLSGDVTTDVITITKSRNSDTLLKSVFALYHETLDVFNVYDKRQNISAFLIRIPRTMKNTVTQKSTKFENT